MAVYLAGAGTAAAAAALYTHYSYPSLPPSTTQHVGCCRVRFKGSVAAQIYYPTSAPPTQPSYPLFRRPDVLTHLARSVHKPVWLFQLFGLSRVSTPCITATDEPGTPPPPVVNATNTAKLPVVVFSHGLYGNCDLHTAFSSQLAQEGYIVVVLEHEGGAASYCRTEEDGAVLDYIVPPTIDPDTEGKTKQEQYQHYLQVCRGFRGPMLRKREEEIEIVVQCLKGAASHDTYPLEGATGLPFAHSTSAKATAAAAHCKHLLGSIDGSHMILAGHSFGGATAVVAAQSTRPGLANVFQCCLLYDPWTECLDEAYIKQGLGDLPTFCLLSDGWSRNNIYPLTQQLFAPEKTTNVVVATLPGTQHQWVADTVFWFPKFITDLAKQTGAMEPRLALKATVCASLRLIAGDPLPWELEKLGMVTLAVPGNPDSVGNTGKM